ncbi:hypothetical protein ASE40_16510 [Flavobacterium sp. Root935]|uniref:hypothetical protein n=1 Tax=Flavobacterium sp. Root935 TaxID=1736610 RepID=UPI00070A1633|nr:hypothetical protein [Flavobacterium sp. Root935]KRD57948.1 hypothetical protein ASE40_16510 [Flavobacterium sp. Root935]
MKKFYILGLLLISISAVSQINSPNGNNIFYYNGLADVIFRFPDRGSGGRAIVHDTGNVLSLNYASDFTGGTRIGADVFFKDGGNSYIYSGNFGIGSYYPAYKLDVMGSIGVGNESVNANTTKIFLRNPAGKTWAISSGANMITESSFSIYNWTDDTSHPFFHISNNGNIGIGTFAPEAKLHVAGDLQNNGHILLGHIGETNYLTSREVNQQLGVRGSNSIVFGTYTDGWKDRMMISNVGNIGIGVNNPTNKLDVNGTIHSKEVKVDMIGWPDYVFKKEYKLPTLEEVEKHINEKGHLENIPSEAEVLKNGINLGEMNIKLLQKIEELTLYMIEMKKENESIKRENSEIKKDISILKQIKKN